MADLAGTNTFNSLNGHFKQTYSDKIVDLRPDGVKVLNSVKFMAAEKQPGDLN